MKRSQSSEAYHHCSLAPLEAFDLDDNNRKEPRKDPNEAKRQKRMQRNRESAAISRERKRAYLKQLELRFAELAQIVATLRAENAMLRSGRAPSTGGAPVPTALLIAPAKPHLEDAHPFMPCLQSSDTDSESNDGMDTLELYSSLELFKLFSQEPLT